jgi:hypothetical protein
MTRILGYETTKDREALAAFMAEALTEYEALEQAIAAVDEQIEDLKQDWEPRELSFWSKILRTFLPAIRKATARCLNLFGKKRSQAVPVPLIICGTHIGYTCDLHCIHDQIEEAGILLTSYLCTPLSNLSVETRDSQRQRLLRALEQLSQAVHEAVDKGRVKLKDAPQEQCTLLRHLSRKASYLLSLKQTGGRQVDE